MSLNGTCGKPSGSGVNGVMYASLPVAVTVASVRPWKACSAVMTRVRAVAVALAPFARELDRGLVGLGAAVAEEDPIERRMAGEQLRPAASCGML